MPLHVVDLLQLKSQTRSMSCENAHKTIDGESTLLGPTTDFLIGFVSGVVGSALAFAGLPRIHLALYAVFLPTIIFETMEHAILTLFSNNDTKFTTVSLGKIRHCKAQVQQAFGQGVIFGKAIQQIAHRAPYSNSSALLLDVLPYAGLWLCWAILFQPVKSKSSEKNRLCKTKAHYCEYV